MSSEEVVATQHINYQIESTVEPTLFGPAVFTLHLLFTKGGDVFGSGVLKPASLPGQAQPDINTGFYGHHMELGMGMPPHQELFISICADGFPAGPSSTLPPNVRLHMVLQPNWETGTASYSYLDSDGWHTNTHNVVTRVAEGVVHS